MNVVATVLLAIPALAILLAMAANIRDEIRKDRRRRVAARQERIRRLERELFPEEFPIRYVFLHPDEDVLTPRRSESIYP
jgi:hypothetical protein